MFSIHRPDDDNWYCGKNIMKLLRRVFSNDDAFVSGEYFALLPLCFVLVVQDNRVSQ